MKMKQPEAEVNRGRSSVLSLQRSRSEERNENRDSKQKVCVYTDPTKLETNTCYNRFITVLKTFSFKLQSL